MPRFLKNCNNPFHGDWSKGVGKLQDIQLERHGLSELAHGFAKSISSSASKRRSFSRHLAKQSNDAIKEKID